MSPASRYEASFSGRSCSLFNPSVLEGAAGRRFFSIHLLLLFWPVSALSKVLNNCHPKLQETRRHQFLDSFQNQSQVEARASQLPRRAHPPRPSTHQQLHLAISRSRCHSTDQLSPDPAIPLPHTSRILYPTHATSKQKPHNPRKARTLG